MKNVFKQFLFAILVCFSLSVQAATIKVPDSFLYDATTGAIDVNTDTIKCGLATNAYSYNRATHTKRSDITNEVAAGSGYSTGGQTASSVTVTNDTTNHKLVTVISPLAWGTSTITARYLFCYKSRGGASSADELIVISDFGSDISSTSGTFTVNPITIEYTHPN